MYQVDSYGIKALEACEKPTKEGVMAKYNWCKYYGATAVFMLNDQEIDASKLEFYNDRFNYGVVCCQEFVDNDNLPCGLMNQFKSELNGFLPLYHNLAVKEAALRGLKYDCICISFWKIKVHQHAPIRKWSLIRDLHFDHTPQQ